MPDSVWSVQITSSTPANNRVCLLCMSAIKSNWQFLCPPQLWTCANLSEIGIVTRYVALLLNIVLWKYSPTLEHELFFFNRKLYET